MSTVNSVYKKLYTFSVTVTGRCDSKCGYCHYYLTRNRKSFSYDISTEQFSAYMDFIRHWNKTMPGKTYYRFSGGEPTILGDKLFQLADIGFQKTGLRPFVLTAGKYLNKSWIKKARQSKISHVFVSVENPINPDGGAPNPMEIVKKIRNYNSPELPIVPGVCVVPNNCFKHIYKICEWFYEELGRIPLICEINYGLYKSPNEDEWQCLENTLPAVIKDFFPKTQLNLFSSIVPEYAYGGSDPYVLELDLENTHKIDKNNYKTKLNGFVDRLNNTNYPKLNCFQINCCWQEFCQNTKWYWRRDATNSSALKLRDYCRFKRIISDSYYRILVDSKHQKTVCFIKTNK